MPFACQLKFPAYEARRVEATLNSWGNQISGMLSKGDVIASIAISNSPYVVCVNFSCGCLSKVARVGEGIKTGDIIARCGADGESIPYGKDYLYIREP